MKTVRLAGVKNEEELRTKFLQAVQIIIKENEWLEKWMTHYGSENRKQLERWRIKSKAFIESLHIETINDDEQIQT